MYHTSRSSLLRARCFAAMQAAAVDMPFLALWMRSEPGAVQAVCRNLHAFGLRKTLAGSYSCLCEQEFVGVNAMKTAAGCSVQHAKLALTARVKAFVPTTSVPGLGGRWLEEGEECGGCGSLAGGWLCAGHESHMASCEEAKLFEGQWSALSVGSDGSLAVDKTFHCVHFDGTFQKRTGGWQQFWPICLLMLLQISTTSTDCKAGLELLPMQEPL